MAISLVQNGYNMQSLLFFSPEVYKVLNTCTHKYLWQIVLLLLITHLLLIPNRIIHFCTIDLRLGHVTCLSQSICQLWEILSLLDLTMRKRCISWALLLQPGFWNEKTNGSRPYCPTACNRATAAKRPPLM